MKSIKEKANEYVLGFHSSIQRMCKESYIDGANYVLEEIEKLLPKEDKNLNDYGKALVWRIKDAIEQLKK